MGIVKQTHARNRIVSDLPLRNKRQGQLLLPHTIVQLDELASPCGKQLQQFVSTCFRGYFDADVHSHLPYFLSAYSAESLVATLGFEPVEEDKAIFLEQYLECAVEQVISQKIGRAISRLKVVELGSLSSARKGFSELIFILIADILYKAGFEWVVLTATPQVHKLVNKLGLTTIELCVADPIKLDDKGQSWGHYYESKPKVLAGDLHYGIDVLHQHEVAGFMLKNYENTINKYAKKLMRLAD